MSNTNHIRLVIAEGDERLREALAAYFGGHEGFEVMGLAADHVQASNLSRQLKPDILLIDPAMQPENAVDLIQTLCQESANTKVIVLSSSANGITEDQMLRAGAARYIEKGIMASDLIGAIRRVYHQH